MTELPPKQTYRGNPYTRLKYVFITVFGVTENVGGLYSFVLYSTPVPDTEGLCKETIRRKETEHIRNWVYSQVKHTDGLGK